MRVLICGDRNWANVKVIRNVIKKLKPTVIIEGGAKGADRIAWDVAEELDIKALEFKADWLKEGRAAGPIRNKKMLVEGKPDLVVAFHNDIDASKGTKNMLKQAQKAGIATRLFTEKGEVE